MTFPTVHSGGTHIDTLIEDNDKARYALSLAQKALVATGPNQRDYYLTAGAWENALAEHESRLARISLVIKDLEAVREYLSREQDEREARKAGR